MSNSSRNIWIDYLRSAVTVLVVAHHSSLAYTTFAKYNKDVYINSTHPIVDTKKWIGLDIFENFNDVFFMSLLFLVGGLFLMNSIKKKGVFSFVKDRFYRLFIPFLFLGTPLMLIAFYPSYFVGHADVSLIAYIKDFFVVEQWPAGTPWFIWILFVFNVLFALFYKYFKKLGSKIERILSNLANKPACLFFIIYSITCVLYIPLSIAIGPGVWVGVGPFDFQLNRIFLYFGYFVLGVLIGNTDFNNRLFSKKSKVFKNTWFWLFASLFIYAILTILGGYLMNMVKENQLKELSAWMIYDLVYVASCVFSCLAFITVFRKCVNKENSLMNSLSENAYMIYLVHFVFVIWSQFIFMRYDIPAFVKFFATFIVSLSLSWGVSVLLRKIDVIRKYI